MNSIRILLFRGFLLAAVISSCVYFMYGKSDGSMVDITRNVARNDLVTQIRSLPDDSPQDFLDKELIVIQKFLKTHETEVRVGIYDLEVFMAIDRARARLQKADKDLETLRNELSYKEQQTQAGK
jgi:hypothetical protein